MKRKGEGEREERREKSEREGRKEEGGGLYIYSRY